MDCLIQGTVFKPVPLSHPWTAAQFLVALARVAPASLVGVTSITPSWAA